MESQLKSKWRCAAGAIVLAAGIVGGCKPVGPDYRMPEPTMPATFLAPTSQPTTRQSVAAYVPPAELSQWWTTLNDPELNSLIDRAIKSNLSLQQAESRIRQARASRIVTRSGYYPNLDASGSYRRTGSLDTGIDKSRDLFQGGLDAGWEIDIFGGTRRSIEAADANVQSSIEDQRDVLVTLTSEVALSYIDLRGFQRQIQIARQNSDLQRRSLSITQQQQSRGFGTRLDVANAQATVAGTESQIPSLEAAVRQTIYSISVLLGQQPAALLGELSESGPIPRVPREIPIGLPSDLLRRRPDIRRAEADLHSATANIGVATAALYPRFNLAGSIGVQSNTIRALFNGSNIPWSIGPGVSWPIFEAGRIRGNIQVQTEFQQQTLLNYQQTLLNALQDVENALISYEKEQQRREILEVAVSANRVALDQANLLYNGGETDFLNVISAQRSLFSTEDALVQSDRNIASNLITLYKALGGGWNEAPAGK